MWVRKRDVIGQTELRSRVVTAIFRIRATRIWGDGTTACASDAKQFGAWDQNLPTEWHLRYGGRGVMVYSKDSMPWQNSKRLKDGETQGLILTT
jgi:TnpA family transposase